VDVLAKFYTWALARILSKWGTLVGLFLVLPALGSLQKEDLLLLFVANDDDGAS
jgi:hypothetical protein